MNSSQPLADREAFLVAEFVERNAANQFHDKVRPACFRRPRIMHLGDVRVIHHRQGLPLRFEAGDHLLAIHARLYELQRHQPPHRPLLLGHIDQAHAAFADLLQEFVGADQCAELFSGLDRR